MLPIDFSTDSAEGNEIAEKWMRIVFYDNFTQIHNITEEKDV